MKIKHHTIYKFIMISFFIFTLLLFTEQKSTALSVSHTGSVIFAHPSKQNQQKQLLINKITNKNNHSNKKNKKPILKATENDESSVWSNAFNFNKSWGTEVDSRTGILSAYFKVGSLLSNIGHGPNISLQINYNSSSFANPDGLGSGWNWNLTHFNPATNQLTTSSGQNFYLQQTDKNHWQPLYHKLHDIQISGDKSTHFIMTYANGLRETLSHEGYEIRLEQQDSWGVNFIYLHGTHLLQSIVDDEGNQMTLKRSQSYLDIISHAGNGQPVTIRIINHNKKPDKVVFLLKHSDNNPFVYIHYKNHLLNRMIYPAGLQKIFTFNCTNAMRFSLQRPEIKRSLCVISTEATNPGAGQPVMTTHYIYSQASGNEHNYLGFNAGLNSAQGMSKDILFEAPVEYTYRTVIDNGLVKEVHTYNKYHLLIDNKLISNSTHQILSETENFFCNTKLKDGCAQTSFENLPATYSLPLKIISRVWGISSSVPAVNMITRTYDHLGHVISTTDSYGRVTVAHYCPLNGDAACPAEPQDWPFTTLPESVTLYPAPSTPQTQPPAVTVYNIYRKKANLHGNGYMLILDHQIRQAGNKNVTLTRHYYNNSDGPFKYGLLKQMVLTGTTEPSSLLHSVVHDYYYTRSADGHRKTIQDAIELGDNLWKMHGTTTSSLFTNQVFERTDPAGKNTTHYHYDAFGRLIQTDLAVGTTFASTLHYQYLFSPEHNQAIITAANGLQQKIVFDNAGRELMRFNEAISSSGKTTPGHWQLKKAIRYDAWGRVTEQKLYIRDTHDEIQALKTTKDYDDMGRISHIYLPDGEKVFMLYDNTNRCMVSYRQSYLGVRSALAVVLGNVLDKPIEKRLISASTGALPAIKVLCNQQNNLSPVKISTITYDGFGRPVTEKGPLGRIVRKHYDVLGHLDDMTDSVGNHIHQLYNLNGQIIERQALPASGGSHLLSSTGYNAAGQLLYKAGEDGKKTTYTYTKNGQLAAETTPAGHIFSWQYNLLNLPVASYVDGKVLLQSDYDPVTARPIKKIDITGITTWSYSIDGLLNRESHTGKNGYLDYQLLSYYDNNRRKIGITDISGDFTWMHYDKFGRVSALSYQPQNGPTETLFARVYDDFSRVKIISYGSGMQREIHYDAWGHQQQVTDTLVDKLLSRWKFDYDANDSIVTLRQQTDNDQQSVLSYKYDVLNNLVSMRCQGSQGLSLCPRDTAISGSSLHKAPIITRQDYTFTPLNRLSQVSETLQNPDTKQTFSKTVIYGYGNIKAPLRLQQISTAWNQNIPITRHLSYDITGNMTTDGEGNKITYNAFKQITQVTKINGESSLYFYNGGGQEAMEKTTTGTSYLLYRNKHLINEKIISAEETHIIGYQGIARTIDGIIHEYEENNYRGDITGILTKTANSHQYTLSQHNIYSPYGMVWHSTQVPLPLYLQNFLGFDGERTDPATGWQFLGAGHRTYNPQQRYFVSEDPAGDGYAFGSNNPIMETDPTGNLSKGLNTMFTVMRCIGTVGLSLIHSKWGALAGSTVMLGVSLVAVGIMAIFQQVDCVFAGSVMGVIALSSFVSISAGIQPSNKGLNIAAAVVGVAQLTATLVAAGFSLVPRIFTALSSMVNAENITETAAAENNVITNIGANAGEPVEVQNMAAEDRPALWEAQTQLGRQLQERVPHLVSTSSGDRLHLSDFNDIREAQTAFESYDNDIGMVLTSSMIKNRPLDIEKLEILLNARENLELNAPEYRTAFRNLMHDFSAYSDLAENIEVTQAELFPVGNNATIVANNIETTFVMRDEAEEGIYKVLMFKRNGNPTCRTGTLRWVLRFFINDNNEISVNEYFRLDN